MTGTLAFGALVLALFVWEWAKRRPARQAPRIAEGIARLRVIHGSSSIEYREIDLDRTPYADWREAYDEARTEWEAQGFVTIGDYGEYVDGSLSGVCRWFTHPGGVVCGWFAHALRGRTLGVSQRARPFEYLFSQVGAEAFAITRRGAWDSPRLAYPDSVRFSACRWREGLERAVVLHREALSRLRSEYPEIDPRPVTDWGSAHGLFQDMRSFEGRWRDRQDEEALRRADVVAALGEHMTTFGEPVLARLREMEGAATA